MKPSKQVEKDGTHWSLPYSLGTSYLCSFVMQLSFILQNLYECVYVFEHIHKFMYICMHACMYVCMYGWMDGWMVQALPIWRKITRVVIAQLSIAVFIQSVWCYQLALEALSISPSGRNRYPSLVTIIVVVIVIITYVAYDVCMSVCMCAGTC